MPDLTIEVTETPAVEVEVAGVPGLAVTVSEDEGTVSVTEVPTDPVVVEGEPTLEAVEVGIPGPAGPQGAPGPQGPPGSGGDLNYTHEQSTPSAVWLYEHGLGKYPAVRTFGTDGVEMEGDVTYPDIDTVRVEFSGSMSGTAYNN